MIGTITDAPNVELVLGNLKNSIALVNIGTFSDAPNVELVLGKSISAESIYEGGDAYFDCR